MERRRQQKECKKSKLNYITIRYKIKKAMLEKQITQTKLKHIQQQLRYYHHTINLYFHPIQVR